MGGERSSRSVPYTHRRSAKRPKRSVERKETTLAVQESVSPQSAIEQIANSSSIRVEDDRPPACPRCQRRFVILSSQWYRTASGTSIRRQLWGCPRGHAIAYRSGGAFDGIEPLQDLVD
jgi:hypothetical protein